MYLYFDKNGVLLEAINDEALRQYNNQVNTLYIYIEDSMNEIRSLQYWFGLPDGTETEVYSTSTRGDVIIHESIPFDSKRDLKYFKYGIKYDMYKIPIPSGKKIAGTDKYEYNVFAQSGLVELSIKLIYESDKRKELTLGKVVFSIEDEVVLPSDTISVSQFEYLLYAIDNVVESNKDYNRLINKPQINGVTLQGDKSAVELRLVPTQLFPFQAAEKPTRSFRQTAEVFVDDKDNGARMTLQTVKSMGTKIVTTEDVKSVDFDLLDKGDFVYVAKKK